MAIKIEEINRQPLVAALNAAAGKATASTIRDLERLKEAVKFVDLDLERRFDLPKFVNFKALFTSGGKSAYVTKLTLLRSGGIWHLDSAIRKRPSYRSDYVRYEADPRTYDMFRIFAKDGRSMPSVDIGEEVCPLSGHEQLQIMALQREQTKQRRVRRAKL
jgi:hypothetical protein